MYPAGLIRAAGGCSGVYIATTLCTIISPKDSVEAKLPKKSRLLESMGATIYKVSAALRSATRMCWPPKNPGFKVSQEPQ